MLLLQDRLYQNTTFNTISTIREMLAEKAGFLCQGNGACASYDLVPTTKPLIDANGCGWVIRLITIVSTNVIIQAQMARQKSAAIGLATAEIVKSDAGIILNLTN